MLAAFIGFDLETRRGLLGTLSASSRARAMLRKTRHWYRATSAKSGEFRTDKRPANVI
jgi:hypothetical protein